MNRSENTDSNNCTSVGSFLRHLAESFETHRRTHPVGGSPLKRMNDEEFRPRFVEIVANASQGRIKASSQLNVGGQWYRIPNISAFDREREPYGKTDGRGRLGLQVHYSGDYSTVSLSMVLMFNLPESVKDGQMTEQVRQRYGRIMEHVRGTCPTATEDAPTFLHWIYDKNHALWSKPLLGFSHQIAEMPTDRVLLEELEILARALDGAMEIS